MRRPSSPRLPSLRASDDPRAVAAVQEFIEAGGRVDSPEVRHAVAALGEHARALFPLVLSDPTIIADVFERPLFRDDSEMVRERFMAATAALEDGTELRHALRGCRHRALVRIALREVLRIADIDQTAAEMSALAAAAVDAALAACLRTAERRFGPIVGERGPVPIVVLGMGKLAGRELNLGSDIDLCFFYETDDAQVGDGSVSLHEVYSRVASWTTKSLSEVTEDGFCFRVDLRLRPEGSRGPLVASLASAERYYEAFGRPWERAVLLRSRPIAGDLAFGNRLLTMLAPFVYRREVDPTIAETMAEMVWRSRRELAGGNERDVKHGRGGIREAEFFVQSLQLIWGGQVPQLRVPGTIDALRRLRAAGLVEHAEADNLERAWALLRRVEHRIHMQTPYATHRIPEGDAAEPFARSMGFEDYAAFDRALSEARQSVATLFDSLLSDGRADERRTSFRLLAERVGRQASDEELAQWMVELGVRDEEAGLAHLRRLARGSNAPLGLATLKSHPDFGPLLLAECAGAANPDAALRLSADFFSRLGGAWGYDRLLVEKPTVARRLVGLFGASGTLSASLIGYPEALEAILLSSGPPSLEEILRVHAPALSIEPDVESTAPVEELVAALRTAKREMLLRVGLALVAEEIDARESELLLTAIADAQIEAALRFALHETVLKLGQPTSVPRDPGRRASMAVIAMGKLGGQELGFGSDLDLIFLYDCDGDTQPTASGRSATHAEVFTRAAQRCLRLLSQPDAGGPGYETDARLRPGGSKGMLVVSLAAFDRYHREHARAWERQALIRARVVVGAPPLTRALEERFVRLAYEQGPMPAAEMAALRARFEEELGNEGVDRYHPKVGYGGLLDVEFLVQWLQMRHGNDRRVRHRGTLDALGGLRDAGYLDPTDAEALEDGYRFFRSIGQAIKLLDDSLPELLNMGGGLAHHVARRLGLRDRDGVAPVAVLRDLWKRHAVEVRELFEELVAPIGRNPPWEVG